MGKARTKTPVLTLPRKASGAILANRCVTYAGAQAGAKANIVGVADCDAAAGEYLPVVMQGMMAIEAGAAIAEGAKLETDAQGRAVTFTDGPVIGRALSAASGAGQMVEALLTFN